MLFLSYSRLNKEAYRLEAELNEAGIPYRRDMSLVEGDPFWRQAIRAALEDSTVLVVVWSQEASQSPYISQEIRAFKKDIVFVTLDETKIPVANAEVLGLEQAVTALGQLVQERTTAKIDGKLDDMKIVTLREHRLIEEKERLHQFKTNFGREPRIRAVGNRAVNQWDGAELKDFEKYYLAVDPVTNWQYTQFIEATGRPSPPTWNCPDFSSPQLPVTGITWFEAQAYASWVGGTLPTEREWEAAARGDTNFIYSTYSGELDPSLAYYGFGLGEGAPCPVDAFPPNSNGLRGMCGNVWDWCASRWDGNNIIKGGGYMDDEMFCRIDCRYRNFPIDRDCCVGFRVKIDIDRSPS